MKKLLSFFVGLILFSGCFGLKTNEESQTPKREAFIVKRLDSNEKFSLVTENQFETAVLEKRTDKVELSREVSGSGIRMGNTNKKNELHFKGKEGVLSFNGKEFKVSVERV